MNRVKSHWLLMMIFSGTFFSSFEQRKISNQSLLSSIKLTFVNTINGNRLFFNDSTYVNPFGEKYTISKLRYYVSNVSLQGGHSGVAEKESYHLIDESKQESKEVQFSIPGGDYNSLHFLLGVDSLRNVSGAQTGDLDPANDMFWTWNSGYVMAKMEGNSAASNQVNNKFEFHIGGFSGTYNVLKRILLNFPNKTFHFADGKTYQIVIKADINAWWQHPHDIKISEHPVITSPGKPAREISENYANMFHIEKIISE